MAPNPRLLSYLFIGKCPLESLTFSSNDPNFMNTSVTGRDPEMKSYSRQIGEFQHPKVKGIVSTAVRRVLTETLPNGGLSAPASIISNTIAPTLHKAKSLIKNSMLTLALQLNKCWQ